MTVATPPGAPGTGIPRVCLARPQLSAYSETFLHQHERILGPDVKVLYGASLPSRSADRGPILTPSPMARLNRFALRHVLGITRPQLVERALAKYLRSTGREVVLAEYGPTAASMVPACRRARIPLVGHFHGFDAYHRETLATYHEAYLRLFREAAAVVAVSHHMVRQLLSLGAPPERTHYCPYGVNTDFFCGSEPAAQPASFLAVGRFVEKKAPFLTLVTFKQALDELPGSGLSLTMVGDGPLLGSCQLLASGLGLSESVRFAGVQSPAEVAALMKGSRAFVQHSVTAATGDSEGTPVAILEAAASGLPVISTHHAGVPDVVVPEETGLLVDEGDVAGMAKAIVRLAREPATAQRMGSSGRARVRDMFGHEDAARRLRDLVCRVARSAT